MISASSGFADLLGPDREIREIPFMVIDAKPMIAARVGEKQGLMMFDTGTPDAIFLNRDSVKLDDGTFLTKGRAASGQTIEVFQHLPPPILLAGEEINPEPVIRSGNFNFTAELFGNDFLGFIGQPAVEKSAFVLDYNRQVLTILATAPNGSPVATAPYMNDILVRIDFVINTSGLPMSSGRIGTHAVTVDFDTGDSGSLYLSEKTLAQLATDGLLSVNDDRGVITEFELYGALFPDLSVRLVRAGSSKDTRVAEKSDHLRLGARFFTDHLTLWNYPSGTIDILR